MASLTQKRPSTRSLYQLSLSLALSPPVGTHAMHPATAIYLDRLMRSENLLLASQYYNYFISRSLIILLFTTARRDYDYFPSLGGYLFVFHLHGDPGGIKSVLSARFCQRPRQPCINRIRCPARTRGQRVFCPLGVIVTANSSSSAALFYR